MQGICRTCGYNQTKRRGIHIQSPERPKSYRTGTGGTMRHSSRQVDKPMGRRTGSKNTPEAIERQKQARAKKPRGRKAHNRERMGKTRAITGR